MARIYSNENFPFLVVQELRAHGHDVVTIQERGYANTGVSDNDVIHFATSESRAVLTLNRRHFIALHELFPQHAGIIVCTVDPDFRAQAARIHRELEAIQDLAGKLVRVTKQNKF